jgi:hypothetical protein
MPGPVLVVGQRCQDVRYRVPVYTKPITIAQGGTLVPTWQEASSHRSLPVTVYFDLQAQIAATRLLLLQGL